MIEMFIADVDINGNIYFFPHLAYLTVYIISYKIIVMFSGFALSWNFLKS